MKILICPAHYLFSDKYGSETLWSYEIICALSKKIDQLDVIVGVIDVSRPVPEHINVIALYKNRSKNVLVEFLKRLFFYPLLLLCFIILSSKNHYDVVHHLFPLSFATLNPVVFWVKLFGKNTKVFLGPAQLPQIAEGKSDLAVVLVGSEAKGLVNNGIVLIYTILFAIVKPLSKLMFQSANLVICNSQTSKKFYQTEVPKASFGVIPTGINLRVIEKKKRKSPEIKILCVGGLNLRKGQIYLLKAFKKLIEKYPLLSLTLVGKGELEEEYKEFIKQNNLLDKAMVVSVPHDKVWSFYASHDIFCLPSISDPSPTVLLEAMMAGLPVVATDVGSVKEMVADAGIIIPAQDEEKLVQGLTQVIESEKLRDKLGYKGKERIKNIYDWEKVTYQYISLYTQKI